VKKIARNLCNSKEISNFAAQKWKNNINKLEYDNEKNISAAQSPSREQARLP
jgi:hypothetical protein